MFKEHYAAKNFPGANHSGLIPCGHGFEQELKGCLLKENALGADHLDAENT